MIIGTIVGSAVGALSGSVASAAVQYWREGKVEWNAVKANALEGALGGAIAGAVVGAAVNPLEGLTGGALVAGVVGTGALSSGLGAEIADMVRQAAETGGVDLRQTAEKTAWSAAIGAVFSGAHLAVKGGVFRGTKTSYQTEGGGRVSLTRTTSGTQGKATLQESGTIRYGLTRDGNLRVQGRITSAQSGPVSEFRLKASAASTGGQIIRELREGLPEELVSETREEIHYR